MTLIVYSEGFFHPSLFSGVIKGRERRSRDQEIKRSRDEEMKRSRDQEIKRSRDEEMKRSRDQEIKRSRDRSNLVSNGRSLCDAPFGPVEIEIVGNETKHADLKVDIPSQHSSISVQHFSPLSHL